MWTAGPRVESGSAQFRLELGRTVFHKDLQSIAEKVRDHFKFRFGISESGSSTLSGGIVEKAPTDPAGVDSSYDASFAGENAAAALRGVFPSCLRVPKRYLCLHYVKVSVAEKK